MRVVKRTMLSLVVSGLMILPGVGFAQSNSSNSQPAAEQSGQMPNPQTSNGKYAAKKERSDRFATGQNSKLDQQDQQFIRKAAADDMAEVELGKLAQQKASSNNVKDFANTMVSQHQQNLDQLKQVAQKENVEIPSTPSAKEQAIKDKLSNLNGQAFDRAYMKHMVRDHSKDVPEFKAELNKTSDPDLKSYIQQTLPVLEHHEQMAKQVQSGQSGMPTSAKSSNPSY